MHGCAAQHCMGGAGADKVMRPCRAAQVHLSRRIRTFAGRHECLGAMMHDVVRAFVLQRDSATTMPHQTVVCSEDTHLQGARKTCSAHQIGHVSVLMSTPVDDWRSCEHLAGGARGSSWPQISHEPPCCTACARMQHTHYSSLSAASFCRYSIRCTYMHEPSSQANIVLEQARMQASKHWPQSLRHTTEPGLRREQQSPVLDLHWQL